MRTMVLTLLIAGCGDKGDTGEVAELTFAEVDAVLVQSCGFSSCHGGGEGGLTLDGDGDYDALVGVESTVMTGAILVTAGSADGSYLIDKMEGAGGIEGDPMPPSGLLDAATVSQIRDWIDRGAAND
ncbi:MAG: hypothetical protein ACI8RZ_004030 [Myxococcota bacterium]|jgi:hypothetical protein